MKNRVFNYIKDFGSITTWEAIKDLGCTRLSAYIYMLRQDGYNITSKRIPFVNRYGDKSFYFKYILEEE